MSHLYEVNIFPASPAFQANPSICTKALDIVMDSTHAVHAHSPCYYGKECERPSYGYNFVHWDGYQAHMDVTDDPKIFPDLLAALKPSLAGSPVLCHAAFAKDPTKALASPFTQVTKLTVTDPGNRTKVLQDLSGIALDSFTFGPTYEDANKVIVICGHSVREGLWEISKTGDLYTRVGVDFDVHVGLKAQARKTA